MVQAKPTIIELDMDKLEEILRRVEAKNSTQKDYETIKAVIESYVYLTELVGDKNTTIAGCGRCSSARRPRRPRRWSAADRTRSVLGAAGDDGHAGVVRRQAMPKPMRRRTRKSSGSRANRFRRRRTKGHGRNGADAYTGAEKIEVRHQSLQPGDPCPKCETGTVYETHRPGVLVRLVGQAPVGAKVYYLQKLRCNLCGAVFTAEPPEGVDAERSTTRRWAA